jgi:hypothetical protein
MHTEIQDNQTVHGGSFLTRRGQAVRDDVVDAVARGAHEVGRGAREVVRGAREVEQFAIASKTDQSTARS